MNTAGTQFAGCPVIIGAGLAGMMTALHLASEPCVLLNEAPLGEQAASAWAQGGIAAAIGSDDTPSLHAADTVAAGDGLCDAAAVARLTGAGPGVIKSLLRYGVQFDRVGSDGSDPEGLSLGLEAAHARRRIVHAQRDGTGREIVRALAQSVRNAPSIRVMDRVRARRLLLCDGQVAGVLAEQDGRCFVLPAGRVIVATGGVGGLFSHTTNPLGATGSGLALAAHAGAMLADLEFVQFHPTALDAGSDPMGLISEAVRGEGARLIDETGVPFTDNDLAPRDVVARAVWRHLARGHRVFLDASPALGARFAEQFPSVASLCLAAGIDPTRQPIPVRPAAHYHMGGIAVDAEGRSSVPGLWACGEVACTGLHGANRLASNSLLEAAASAPLVARSVAETADWQIACPPVKMIRPARVALAQVRVVMGSELGVLRHAPGIESAIRALEPLAEHDDTALVGMMIAVAALRRRESRGSHFRTDYPTISAIAVRSHLTLANAWQDVAGFVGADVPRLAV
jgi:L-aspartate oxidase